ncbi:hypothetical protein HZC07_03880 [Candidatus Micrarchaeota archaeon]|nr:hypothetical protein [Candidatus Micrarchaeota archaeon]
MRLSVIFFLIALLTFGCLQNSNQNQSNTTNRSQNTTTSSKVNSSNFSMTELLCQNSGGNWNPCGSSCAGAPPGDACIQSCVEQCECGGNFICPPSYSCQMTKTKGSPQTLGVCKLATSK